MVRPVAHDSLSRFLPSHLRTTLILPFMLLVGLFFASLIILYAAALAQMKQRRLQRLKVTHVSERPTEWEEPQVRVIAN